ncbi:MAG: glutathione S-transferase family protein [Hyphomonadaceae bacterium]
MALTLYYHPLSSFCWKALIALYETGAPFKTVLLDQTTFAEFKALWPIGKMPALQDEARGEFVPESSFIIEHLDRFYPGAAPLLPTDPDRNREARARDRFLDLYVQVPMQKIVLNRLRPADGKDALGVAEARTMIAAALDLAEREWTFTPWAMGADFTIVECAAAPALFYAEKVGALTPAHTNLSAYFERLKARPSVARVLKEAKPYMGNFPQ